MYTVQLSNKYFLVKLYRKISSKNKYEVRVSRKKLPQIF